MKYIGLNKILSNIGLNELESARVEQKQIIHTISKSNKSLIPSRMNNLVIDLIPNNYELISLFDFMCEN